MARRSLKPQLNQIRAWVHQGRTDAWIAHQLEISATELREFRKQYDLSADDENAGSSEVDLRDEIEAEIEAAAAEDEKAAEAEDEEEAEGDGDDEAGEERGEGGSVPAPPAPPRPPRWTRPSQRDRGELRPRRNRRLRTLARRQRQGQPRLRRALGRQARRHRPHRGRPDRDPPGGRAHRQCRVRRLGRRVALPRCA